MSNGTSHAGALAGKRIVIIGGTAGLGLSAARALVAAGARVVVAGRKPDNVGATRRELGEAAIVLQGEATKPETAVAAVAQAVAPLGGIDGLYHVAGGSGRRWGDGPLHELTDEGWDASQNIRFNVLAPALVDTSMARRAANDATILSFIKTKQPLDGGRIGQPADLDAAAVYFMGDGSKFATGQVLAVDGGWSVSEGQIPLAP